MAFGVKKTRMVWLPDGEKIWLGPMCLFVSRESTNVTDRRTDTAWRHRPRLCIVSRGKKRAQRQTKHTAFKLQKNTATSYECTISQDNKHQANIKLTRENDSFSHKSSKSNQMTHATNYVSFSTIKINQQC